MKTMRQAGRAFARGLRDHLLLRSRALRNKSRVIGKLAFAACAILLLSFGAAQAQSTETIASTIPAGTNIFGQPTTFKAAVTGFPNTSVLVPGGTVSLVVNNLNLVDQSEHAQSNSHLHRHGPSPIASNALSRNFADKVAQISRAPQNHGFASTPPESGRGTPVVAGNVIGNPRRLRTAR